ncbi:hypothetical protein PSN45_000390 [Yamadazyma tenuis]|uniref:Uncharacterized protein n=1 Tax=Candida tenuis (strain ATCC 10573 / BCRC 21748 / CBS 615 / JCM 9827 / NBRC 10315 / NRRL Y-1498 / VKM Y-70) TaxID=590646 RepID=G3B868_CANTC|nr:uncharacterized protein CANTEDRAFT_94588 [Yamadazyma tenuis ATCC 10573]EGV61702.1 hypothetical protein CANTEDRAFT_94588 [Yamadazyma tenuis ATCC 10573]WEJ92932.1 hypothetical protein PSN45_000390 [Yamadazyma tenuis]
MATEIETYEDPIIRLANDPDLNKQIDKTNKLISLISGFSLAERKVSKLCQLSLTILQTLEKIGLNLKNWAFLSLDINSNDHFNNENSNIKDFNNSISVKVLTDCHDINKKLLKISIDLDYITKASRTLTPIEYISDSGTLLTSLTLRNIKLKHELTDKVTVAYSKAKLITIGTELESMITDDDSNTTVETYKTFVASLLSQLNSAIEDEDMTEKHECLAVISDMEKMFDAFKLEKAQEVRQQQEDEQQERRLQLQSPHHHFKSPDTFSSPHVQSEDDSDSVYDSEMGYSMYGSMYTSPMIHSITKSPATTSTNLKNSRDIEKSPALGSSGILHKTTLSEEMPYLMSAFNSARNVEEDIRTFKQEEDQDNQKDRKRTLSPTSVPSTEDAHHVRYPNHKTKIRETLLTSESVILQEPPKTVPFSYLYSNNSLLSRLGIRPQVITTDLPPQPQKELGPNTTSNIGHQHGKHLHVIKDKADEGDETKYDKENSMIKPLTQRNLETHTYSNLNVINDFNDHVE